MICFAEGVDFPSVQYAIIIEPKEMLSFLQESGHLGCDHKPSEAITIWSLGPFPPTSDNPDHPGKASMAQCLQTNICRRLTFQDFDPEVHSCGSSAQNMLCDQCEMLSNSHGLFVPQPLWFDLPYIRESNDPHVERAPAMPAKLDLPITLQTAALLQSHSIQRNAELVDDAYHAGKKSWSSLEGSWVVWQQLAVQIVGFWKNLAFRSIHTSVHIALTPSSQVFVRRDGQRTPFGPHVIFAGSPFAPPAIIEPSAKVTNLFLKNAPTTTSHI
ncbi:hypothetical protein J3R82DRAFT_7745 [Butyriboletus roseoflavus]|nr:hypothetical protein J3R82DRAFT_7745 [Butyriboletus roseoflavus]